jgi:hypothetical protein
MSEKRKPTVTILASVKGKSVKIELFPASLWPRKFGMSDWSRFRVRMHGKWANGDYTFTMTEVLRQLRTWIAKRQWK